MRTPSLQAILKRSNLDMPVIGASHQTGWSGLVATLLELFRSLDLEQVLEGGRRQLSAGGRITKEGGGTR